MRSSQAAKGAGNPFKYGFIGETDTQNARRAPKSSTNRQVRV